MGEKLTSQTIKDKVYTHIDNLSKMKRNFMIIDEIEKKLSILNNFNNIYSQVYDKMCEEYNKNSSSTIFRVKDIFDEIEELIKYINNAIYNLNSNFGEKIYEYKYLEDAVKTKKEKQNKAYFSYQNILEIIKHFAKIRRDAYIRISEKILGKIDNIEEIFEDDPEYLQP